VKAEVAKVSDSGGALKLELSFIYGRRLELSPTGGGSLATEHKKTHRMGFSSLPAGFQINYNTSGLEPDRL